MQDAWVVDQRSVGTWSDIGYDAPTSKNFTYSATSNWTATAKFDLPSGCTNGWTITVNNATSGKAWYQASDNCTVLTPNFKNIGTSGS